MTRVTTIAVALVLACAGCGGDDDDVAIPQGTSTSTTVQETTTSTTPMDAIDEDDVTARYEAFWDARFAANEEPVDPDSPALREYATGAQLEKVIAETRRNQEAGLADGIVYRVDSGEVIDDEVVTHSIDVTMRRVDGEWKVESAQLLQAWDGVEGCALASQ
jgi:hypothetical protein